MELRVALQPGPATWSCACLSIRPGQTGTCSGTAIGADGPQRPFIELAGGMGLPLEPVRPRGEARVKLGGPLGS